MLRSHAPRARRVGFTRSAHRSRHWQEPIWGASLRAQLVSLARFPGSLLARARAALPWTRGSAFPPHAERTRGSFALALPRYGNYRARRRDGHVRLPGRHRVVGCRRLTSPAVLHSRLQRIPFAAPPPFLAHRPASCAHHLQSKIARFAAALTSAHY